MVGTYKTSDNHGRLSDQIIRQVQSIDDIRNEISFHFDKSISNTGDKYFSIRTIESSAELSNKKIKEVVDYSISLSKDIIDIKINQDQRTLKQIKSKIDAIESEFSRLLTLQNVPNTDSRKDVFITELFVELNQLKFDENTLEKKLNDSDLFEYTKLYQEITTNPVISTKTPTIILGSITGFILSIIFIFIRRAFFMK